MVRRAFTSSCSTISGASFSILSRVSIPALTDRILFTTSGFLSGIELPAGNSFCNSFSREFSSVPPGPLFPPLLLFYEKSPTGNLLSSPDFSFRYFTHRILAFIHNLQLIRYFCHEQIVSNQKSSQYQEQDHTQESRTNIR